jgi:hypothetical protein
MASQRAEREKSEKGNMGAVHLTWPNNGPRSPLPVELLATRATIANCPLRLLIPSCVHLNATWYKAAETDARRMKLNMQSTEKERKADIRSSAK